MSSLLSKPWLPSSSKLLLLLLLFATLLQFRIASSISPSASPAPKSNVAQPPKSSPPPSKASPPPLAATPPPKLSPSAAPPIIASSQASSSAPAPNSRPPKSISSSSPSPLPSPKSPPLHASPPAPSPKHHNASHLHSPPPKSIPAHHKSAPPALSPSLPPPSPLAPSPLSGPSSLSPSQVAALRSLQVKYSTPDPCSSSSDLLLCDHASPQHVTALHLANCPSTAKLSTEALFNLSSLQILSFDNCSMLPVHVPSALVKNLKSFMCTESLGKTGTNENAPKLSGVWLSTLHNLKDITVANVEVKASGLNVITEGLKLVTQLTFTGTIIPGLLPKNTWPPNVEYIDVSVNSIRGTIPSQMRKLSQLKHLDLSQNQLKGVIPNFFGELNNLQSIILAGNELSGPIPGSITELFNCSHLDLSNNKLNGSILANISNMRALRYLDLSQNQLTGAIPFNTSFLQRLTTFKIGNNLNLCYNHTAVKSKFLAGIANCQPLADDNTAPAPAPASNSVVSSSGGGNHLSKGGIVGITVVVLVVAAALIFVIVRWRRAREDTDQFVNLRAQRP